MTNRTTLYNAYKTISQIGDHEKLSADARDRLIIFNVFIFSCILFCIPYYVAMFWMQNWTSAFIFLGVQCSFIITLWLNASKQYTTSKWVLLFTTNYAVLFLCLFYGYQAGFRLYYFTAPLVVFTVFKYAQTKTILFSLSFYLSSYILVEFLYTLGFESFLQLNTEELRVIYIFNSVLVFIFIVVLASNFARFHGIALRKISKQNKALIKQQTTLEQLILDKNTLLSETHHRVKNNLAIISGIFDLQLMNHKKSDAAEILRNAKHRIKSMSLIHESLYNYSHVSEIDFRDYVERLIKEIRFTYDPEHKIPVNVKIDAVFFDLSKAIPCGLLINEAITNCYKHAFDGIQSPRIEISLVKKERYRLCIIDNGLGINIQQHKNDTSIGITLIEAFCRQIDADFSIEDKNGTHVCLNFND